MGFVTSLVRAVAFISTPRAFSRPIRCFAFVCFVFFSWYMLWSFLTRKGAFDGSSNDFEYDMEKPYYGSLPNGKCSLDDKNIWNCPDIRTAGKYDVRKAQHVLTRMLLIFDAIAEKIKIRYWLSKGTLLGAARHEGHIPWDTDSDIDMPKEDYFRFLRLGIDLLPRDMVLQRHKQELESEKAAIKKARGSDRNQLSYEVPKLPWSPRFRDNKSCYKYCLKVNCSWHDGILIDIAPLEVNNGYVQNQYPSMWQSILRHFGYDLGFKVFPLNKLQFEGFSFPVPFEWRKILKTRYGDDFMAIPPKHKRITPDQILADPIHSCSEYTIDKSGELKLLNN